MLDVEDSHAVPSSSLAHPLGEISIDRDESPLDISQAKEIYSAIPDEKREHLRRIDHAIAGLVESEHTLPEITPEQADEAEYLSWVGDGTRVLLSPQRMWSVIREYTDECPLWGDSKWEPMPFTRVTEHALNAYSALYGSEEITLSKSGDAWLSGDEGECKGVDLTQAEAICGLILKREGIAVDEDDE